MAQSETKSAALALPPVGNTLLGGRASSESVYDRLISAFEQFGQIGYLTFDFIISTTLSFSFILILPRLRCAPPRVRLRRGCARFAPHSKTKSLSISLDSAALRLAAACGVAAPASRLIRKQGLFQFPSTPLRYASGPLRGGCARFAPCSSAITLLVSLLSVAASSRAAAPRRPPPPLPLSCLSADRTCSGW